MELGPIWRAMRQSKGGYILIGLQIAVTMAIMVNAFAIMQERSVKMGRPSGVDEANTFALESVAFKPDLDHKSIIREDLELLRNTQGVINAVATNSFPLRRGAGPRGCIENPALAKVCPVRRSTLSMNMAWRRSA